VTELPPLNRISSRDSQGLVTKMRVRAKDCIKEAQDNKMGIEKMREFGFESSLAFIWIEQKALREIHKGW
jgi:hypothetical protein